MNDCDEQLWDQSFHYEQTIDSYRDDLNDAQTQLAKLQRFFKAYMDFRDCDKQLSGYCSDGEHRDLMIALDEAQQEVEENG